LPNSFGDTLFAQQGTYAVRITDTLTGCYLLDTIVMRSFPIISANYTTNPNQRCYDLANATITFIDLSVGGTSGSWDFGDGTSEAYVFGQYPTHTYGDTGRFVVELVINNADGCRSTHVKTICVQVEPKIYVPTAFTPNGDGLNEFFKVETIGVRHFRIDLYNRWGERVYEAADKEFLWDGRYKGQVLDLGVYPYVITYTDYLSALPKYQKGVVQIVR
jgi:gliding motility-associated-like protein